MCVCVCGNQESNVLGRTLCKLERLSNPPNDTSSFIFNISPEKDIVFPKNLKSFDTVAKEREGNTLGRNNWRQIIRRGHSDIEKRKLQYAELK